MLRASSSYELVSSCVQTEIKNIHNSFQTFRLQEKSTCPLVFTSSSGCRASENLDELIFSPYMPIIVVMQGKCLFQVISRSET